MTNLPEVEQIITDMGFIPVREILQPMGTIVGVQFYVPGFLLSSTYDRVVRTLEDYDLKIWKNGNAEVIYIQEN